MFSITLDGIFPTADIGHRKLALPPVVVQEDHGTLLPLRCTVATILDEGGQLVMTFLVNVGCHNDFLSHDALDRVTATVDLRLVVSGQAGSWPGSAVAGVAGLLARRRITNLRLVSCKKDSIFELSLPRRKFQKMRKMRPGWVKNDVM